MKARALLLAALGEDRLMSRAELAKLVLYMHGREHVEATDVEAIVAHASSIASDRVVAAPFAGRAGETLDAYFAQGGDAGSLLFGALRYAVALHPREDLTIWLVDPWHHSTYNETRRKYVSAGWSTCRIRSCDHTFIQRSHPCLPVSP